MPEREVLLMNQSEVERIENEETALRLERDSARLLDVDRLTVEVTARFREGFDVAVDGSITAYPGDLARAAVDAVREAR